VRRAAAGGPAPVWAVAHARWTLVGAAKFPRHAQSGRVRSLIDRAVDTDPINNGFSTGEADDETCLPITGNALAALWQNLGSRIRIVSIGQNQKSSVVGDLDQAIQLMTKVPTNPAVVYPALQGGGRKTRQRSWQPTGWYGLSGSDDPDSGADASATDSELLRSCSRGEHATCQDLLAYALDNQNRAHVHQQKQPTNWLPVCT